MSSAAQPAMQSPVKTASWAPTAKVSAGALAAAATTLILALMKKAGWHDLPAEIGAAVTTLMTFGIQYIVPERNA
jgi:hypothetical protein